MPSWLSLKNMDRLQQLFCSTGLLMRRLSGLVPAAPASLTKGRVLSCRLDSDPLPPVSLFLLLWAKSKAFGTFPTVTMHL